MSQELSGWWETKNDGKDECYRLCVSIHRGDTGGQKQNGKKHIFRNSVAVQEKAETETSCSKLNWEEM